MTSEELLEEIKKIILQSQRCRNMQIADNYLKIGNVIYKHVDGDWKALAIVNN